MDNASDVTVFTLSGLDGTEQYRGLLFVLTLLCYCAIWLVNLTVIVTIIVHKNLHEPMYILLCNLCISGLVGTSAFYPKFLTDLLSSAHVISFAGCLVQGFLLHLTLASDLSILLLMAYDRYVAICRPLVYHSLMTRRRVGLLILISWSVPFIFMVISSATTFTSKLCGSHIPRLFCINYSVNQLACTVSLISIALPAFTYTFYGSHWYVILWSYFYLIRTCRQSQESMNKFMQTCLPHLICMIVFACCLLFDLMYIRFGSQNLPQGFKNFMAIGFYLVPPIFNPLIYGLKLTQVRNKIMQFIHNKEGKGSHKFVKKKKVRSVLK